MNLKPVLITLCLFCFSIKLLSQVDSSFYHDLSTPSTIYKPLLNKAEEKRVEKYLQNVYRQDSIQIYVIASRGERNMDFKRYAEYIAERWKLNGIVIAIDNSYSNDLYITVVGDYETDSKYFNLLARKNLTDINEKKLKKIIDSVIDITKGKYEEKVKTQTIYISIIAIIITIIIYLFTRYIITRKS